MTDKEIEDYKDKIEREACQCLLELVQLQRKAQVGAVGQSAMDAIYSGMNLLQALAKVLESV